MKITPYYMYITILLFKAHKFTSFFTFTQLIKDVFR